MIDNACERNEKSVVKYYLTTTGDGESNLHKMQIANMNSVVRFFQTTAAERKSNVQKLHIPNDGSGDE